MSKEEDMSGPENKVRNWLTMDRDARDAFIAREKEKWAKLFAPVPRIEFHFITKKNITLHKFGFKAEHAGVAAMLAQRARKMGCQVKEFDLGLGQVFGINPAKYGELIFAKENLKVVVIEELVH